jgi:serine/threonine protein kinase
MGCCPKKKPENIDNTNYTNDKSEVLNVTENTDTNTSSNKNEINIIESNNEEENEHPLNIKLTYNDFQPIKLLGRGSFGEVILVRLKSTKKVYAMKILDKKILKMKKQQNHTKTERDLMVKINSPFIVNIKSAFQDDTNLYLVSEFMQGGDMFFHMHDGQIVIFSHDKTRFYILELVLALESLHKNNMVYRDLKPENILLDSKGHVKLTDFGLSKILEDEDDKAFTLCGTPQYLAPEVLLKKGYDKMVDWWSLGCVMYEMLMGRLPFAIKRGMINLKIYEKKIDFPRKISNEARDLIEKFLVINPTERLGYGPNGTDDIKNHPFFNGVDWDLAIQKKYKPPFIPKLKNDVDLRYFDNCFTDEPIGGPKRKITIRDRDREPSNEYKGFTYMAESVSKELNNLAKSDDAE